MGWDGLGVVAGRGLDIAQKRQKCVQDKRSIVVQIYARTHPTIERGTYGLGRIYGRVLLLGAAVDPRRTVAWTTQMARKY